MTEPKPDSPAILLQLQELGRLVTYWNALDWQAKWILANLAPNKLTAGMMSADLSIGTVISTARMFARERQNIENRANQQYLKENPGTAVIFQPFYDEVDHYLDGVDRLREYRNHLVHNSQYDPANETNLIVAKLSSRSRFGFHGDQIDTTTLTCVSAKIESFVVYGDKLEKALQANAEGEPTTWPERPPLPDKLKTSPPEWLGDTPLPEPSPE